MKHNDHQSTLLGGKNEPTEKWTHRLPEVVGESRWLLGDGGEFILGVRELLPELRRYLLLGGRQVVLYGRLIVLDFDAQVVPGVGLALRLFLPRLGFLRRRENRVSIQVQDVFEVNVYLNEIFQLSEESLLRDGFVPGHDLDIP